MSDTALAAANFGSTHRKTNRPVRFNLCRRWTDKIIGSSNSPSSSCSRVGAECARERRFGANATRAGNRNDPFPVLVIGFEITLTDESEGRHRLDVSYPFFYWLRKTMTPRQRLAVASDLLSVIDWSYCNW